MREPGYYWVKWDGNWRIGEYCQGDWYLTQHLSHLNDIDFDEIDENRIEREQNKIFDVLIGVFKEASDSEGIYFTTHEQALHVAEYINRRESGTWEKEVNYLKKLIASEGPKGK
jgi:hypothetical protein